VPIELEIAGPVAWLHLRRPAARNALDPAMVRDLNHAVDTLSSRADVRVVLTAADGPSFCGGSDLRTLARLDAAGAAENERQTTAACVRFAELPQPTVALMHGYALGGGLGLALYHDFRLAAADATLGMPEVSLGWVPPWAVGQLVHAVGPSQAKWLLLSGERISGTRAFDVGLVHAAVPAPELRDRGTRLAETLAALPPEAVQRTKRLLNQLTPNGEADAAALREFTACVAQPEAVKNLRRFAST
jgi:enoyl-CoA hydratase/carnithine racemase